MRERSEWLSHLPTDASTSEDDDGERGRFWVVGDIIDMYEASPIRKCDLEAKQIVICLYILNENDGTGLTSQKLCVSTMIRVSI